MPKQSTTQKSNKNSNNETKETTQSQRDAYNFLIKKFNHGLLKFDDGQNAILPDLEFKISEEYRKALIDRFITISTPDTNNYLYIENITEKKKSIDESRLRNLDASWKKYAKQCMEKKHMQPLPANLQTQLTKELKDRNIEDAWVIETNGKLQCLRKMRKKSTPTRAKDNYSHVLKIMSNQFQNGTILFDTDGIALKLNTCHKPKSMSDESFQAAREEGATKYFAKSTPETNTYFYIRQLVRRAKIGKKIDMDKIHHPIQSPWKKFANDCIKNTEMLRLPDELYNQLTESLRSRNIQGKWKIDENTRILQAKIGAPVKSKQDKKRHSSPTDETSKNKKARTSTSKSKQCSSSNNLVSSQQPVINSTSSSSSTNDTITNNMPDAAPDNTPDAAPTPYANNRNSFFSSYFPEEKTININIDSTQEIISRLIQKFHFSKEICQQMIASNDFNREEITSICKVFSLTEQQVRNIAFLNVINVININRLSFIDMNGRNIDLSSITQIWNTFGNTVDGIIQRNDCTLYTSFNPTH